MMHGQSLAAASDLLIPGLMGYLRESQAESLNGDIVADHRKNGLELVLWGGGKEMRSTLCSRGEIDDGSYMMKFEDRVRAAVADFYPLAKAKRFA